MTIMSNLHLHLHFVCVWNERVLRTCNVVVSARMLVVASSHCLPLVFRFRCCGLGFTLNRARRHRTNRLVKSISNKDFDFIAVDLWRPNCKFNSLWQFGQLRLGLGRNRSHTFDLDFVFVISLFRAIDQDLRVRARWQTCGCCELDAEEPVSVGRCLGSNGSLFDRSFRYHADKEHNNL